MNELSTVNKNEVANKVDCTCEIELAKLREMSIKQIDNYGTNIQEVIGSKSSEILEQTKMSELNGIKENIDELAEVTSKQKKLLSKSLVVRKINSFRSNYSKVQSKIDTITKSLEDQQDNLDRYLNYMMEQEETLRDAVDKLRVYEDTLCTFVDELQAENSEDQVKLQVASNRMKLISGTRVNAEQAQIEVLMLIRENQEAKYQIQQIVQNVVPILKMQAVNSVGIRVNKESMEIAEKTRKITGEIIEKNARDINQMAKDLQKNRTRGIVDENVLIKAQDTLAEAIDVVTKASEVEAQTNIELTKSLRKKAEDNKKHIDRLREGV